MWAPAGRVEDVGLHLHRSERADPLVAGLAALLRTPPADPFTPEVVSVPSRGVERWIAQSLAAVLGASPGGTDGVCANVEFPAPARLVARVLAAAGGGEEDPWDPPRLAWHVLDAMDRDGGEPWCAVLAHHLGADPGRRMAVARKFAALFHAYGQQRPNMLLEWRAGRDTDGHGRQLGPDLVWQAELWRRVRAGIGASPAERTGPACAAVRADPALVDLPERLSVFGPTRLTPDQMQVLDAVAGHREVHLWLPHPSAVLWDQVRALAGPRPASPPDRLDDPTAPLPRHPLLHSLGRDSRELQYRLAGIAAPATDEHLPLELGPPTLLAALQADIAANRPPGATPPPGTPADGSIRVHACHGRHRQVEVLREVLLGLLQEDPTLELRDIIVMCPDIEAFAPLLSGSLGLATAGTADSPTLHPGHQLAVRLADRSPRQVNPLLDVAARLLDLAAARLTVPQVLDLAAAAPVRHRFGFDDATLDLLAVWSRDAGVRYGLDAAARRPWGTDGLRENTWAAGLDRLLTGVALDGLDLWTGVLPLEDVDSSTVDAAGRFAEFLDRLAGAQCALAGEQPLERWVAALDDAVQGLTSGGEAWQMAQLQRILADTLAAAGEGAGTVGLRLTDLRALLADALEPRPSRANFRTGKLTVCTLVPMRAVPHRVVVLLGLDDGAFPRSASRDGDDVLGRTPRVGERDARAEDRQLFLDAILAAAQRLVIIRTGADERNGAQVPAAAPLGELLDVLERMQQGAAGRVQVRHPLQPFDARNFTPGELGTPGHGGGGRPFSHDSSAFAGALALQAERRPPEPFLGAPLPAPANLELDLESLIRFLEHPARQFLTQRLGLTGRAEDVDLIETLPVEVDGLEQWAIGDRLLTAAADGTPLERAVAAEAARGVVPPGRLGRDATDAIAAEVAQLLACCHPARLGAAEQRDCAVDLGGGLELTGTIGALHGDRLVRVMYSRLSAKHRLRAWVQLLALCAAAPGRAWTAETVGRAAAGRPPVTSRLRGVPEPVALALLRLLAELYRSGLCAPLPFAARTSAEYSAARARGKDPALAVAAAQRVWTAAGGDGREIGECGDEAHQLAWGGGSLEPLLAAAPLPGLVSPAAARLLRDAATPLLPDLTEEPHLFGQVARLVCHPLAAREVEP